MWDLVLGIFLFLDHSSGSSCSAGLSLGHTIGRESGCFDLHFQFPNICFQTARIPPPRPHYLDHIICPCKSSGKNCPGLIPFLLALPNSIPPIWHLNHNRGHYKRDNAPMVSQYLISSWMIAITNNDRNPPITVQRVILLTKAGTQFFRTFRYSTLSFLKKPKSIFGKIGLLIAPFTKP